MGLCHYCKSISLKKRISFMSLLLFASGFIPVSSAVNKKDILNAVRSYRIENEQDIVKEYIELLSIPNVSADRVNIRKNAEYIKKMMEKRGIKTLILETAGNPVVYGEIKVYGPNTSLHSGHYGNWAPNPAMRLAELLATMKDETGKVTIDGFYDSVVPLSEKEMEAVRSVPNFEENIKQIYGFTGTEGGGITLMEALQLPSLNINGLSSGWVGDQSRTIIPPTATASIDIRLVKGCDLFYMQKCVIEHVKKQGYFVVSDEPDHKTRMSYPFLARIKSRESGYPAYRISMDIPVASRLADALKDYYEYNPVFLPTLGGSLPIYLFDGTLGIPVIGISIVNHDNNQHQPNENLRLGNLWSGIETLAAIFMMNPEEQ